MYTIYIHFTNSSDEFKIWQDADINFGSQNGQLEAIIFF